jgi:hypothetical protein
MGLIGLFDFFLLLWRDAFCTPSTSGPYNYLEAYSVSEKHKTQWTFYVFTKFCSSAVELRTEYLTGPNMFVTYYICRYYLLRRCRLTRYWEFLLIISLARACFRHTNVADITTMGVLRYAFDCFNKLYEVRRSGGRRCNVFCSSLSAMTWEVSSKPRPRTGRRPMIPTKRWRFGKRI